MRLKLVKPFNWQFFHSFYDQLPFRRPTLVQSFPRVRIHDDMSPVTAIFRPVHVDRLRNDKRRHPRSYLNDLFRPKMPNDAMGRSGTTETEGWVLDVKLKRVFRWQQRPHAFGTILFSQETEKRYLVLAPEFDSPHFAALMPYAPFLQIIDVRNWGIESYRHRQESVFQA